MYEYEKATTNLFFAIFFLPLKIVIALLAWAVRKIASRLITNKQAKTK